MAESLYSGARDAFNSRGFKMDRISRIEGFDLAKSQFKAIPANHVCMKALIDKVLPKIIESFEKGGTTVALYAEDTF